MNPLRLTLVAAVSSALALSLGCESINIPPMSRGRSTDQPGLSFESSANSTIDAYDLIVYDRIERQWRARLDTLSSEDYKQGKVKVNFRLHQDGQITGLEIAERTVNYRQTVTCWEAIKDVKGLPPWPPQVRRVLRRDYRDLTFTFYYDNR